MLPSMRVQKSEIQRVLHDEPAFSQMFVAHILARNARVEEDLVDQLFNSTEKRLARLLLLLANFGKEGRPEPILAKISQETLAEMIGTTRSRVSHFMNKFRKLGFINYNGHLEVHNSLLGVLLVMCRAKSCCWHTRHCSTGWCASVFRRGLRRRGRAAWLRRRGCRSSLVRRWLLSSQGL
jgi:hypothetical protein